jgi:hypothetical protein
VEVIQEKRENYFPFYEKLKKSFAGLTNKNTLLKNFSVLA